MQMFQKFHMNKVIYLHYLKEKILKLMKYFKLNIAAIDVVLGKDNKLYFLEINQCLNG